MAISSFASCLICRQPFPTILLTLFLCTFFFSDEEPLKMVGYPIYTCWISLQILGFLWLSNIFEVLETTLEINKYFNMFMQRIARHC